MAVEKLNVKVHIHPLGHSYLDEQPKWIQIELTESSFGDRTDMKGTIEEIRALGIIVAFDDFGTGYSSFSYIKELPADTLKIDTAFTKDIHKNIDCIASGFNVVAEGIEQIDKPIECEEFMKR